MPSPSRWPFLRDIVCDSAAKARTSRSTANARSVVSDREALRCDPQATQRMMASIQAHFQFGMTYPFLY